jgi:hypothetical protein
MYYTANVMYYFNTTTSKVLKNVNTYYCMYSIFVYLYHNINTLL